MGGLVAWLWFVVLALLSPLALAGASRSFSYTHPAGATGEAWRAAFERRGAQATGTDLGTVDPFTRVDAELRVDGTLDTGVLAYPVEGAIRVRATGLTSSEITVSFHATNTLGEELAWSGVLKRASAEVDEELSRNGMTPEAVLRGEMLRLRGGTTCSAALDALTTSPWSEAELVLRDGLDVVADPCLAGLLSEVGRRPSLQEHGASWLATRYWRAPDVARTVELAREYPAPNQDLLRVLQSVRLVESASRRAVAPDLPIERFESATKACRSDCCKVCDAGKACGDSCISRSYTCHKGRGCACNAVEACP